MHELITDLIGDSPSAVDAAIKAAALFFTAAAAFRLTTRRTIAQFAPFDWVAAVAVGAIVGRKRPQPRHLMPPGSPGLQLPSGVSVN